MAKVKRIVRRPWGRKHKGGWIIQPEEMLTALKGGEIAEIGKIRVGAKQLSDLIRLMRFPDQELVISSNGVLEVQTIKRLVIKSKKTGLPQTAFRKSRLQHSFRVESGAWVLNNHSITVIIKPRKF